jgi:septum formation protein
MIPLNDYEIILASGSSRRKDFLESLNIPFTIKTHPVDETCPPSLKGKQIAEFIVQQKNAAFVDTILPKPQKKKAAQKMLKFLSGKSHEVITSVGFLTTKKFEIITETTKVYFKDLTDQEIDHYVENALPLDKAGAYGIQEWIGTIGITQIEGSYTNVVGLPLAQVKDKISLLVHEE